MRPFLPALAALFLLAGCATTSSSPPERNRGSEKIIERQKLVWYIGQEYRFIWDPQVLAEVNRIGITLSRAIGVSDNTFHLYVIDDPGVNAFATPLGDIFIFSGMLSRMHNSSELAGVLGHEMAHVQANHFEQMQRRATLSSIPGFAAAILSKGDPRVIASAIAAAQSYQLHWSREMELQSDRLAIQYLGRTDYDPSGMLGAMHIISRGERLLPSEAPQHLLTHPVTTTRMAALETGLGMAPGEIYRPREDRAWDRLQAVLLAITEKGYNIKRKYRKRLEEGKADANALMGLVLARREEYGEAERYYRLALKEAPDAAVLHTDLGEALFHQGRFEEAREVLERSLELGDRGRNSYSWYYLGEIYKMAGDRRAERKAYEKAVNSWPPIPEAHYQYALLLVDEERLGEADFHFGMAARLRGDFAAALRSFSRAEARLGSDPLWGTKISSEMWRMQ